MKHGKTRSAPCCRFLGPLLQPRNPSQEVVDGSTRPVRCFPDSRQRGGWVGDPPNHRDPGAPQRHALLVAERLQNKNMTMNCHCVYCLSQQRSRSGQILAPAGRAFMRCRLAMLCTPHARCIYLSVQQAACPGNPIQESLLSRMAQLKTVLHLPPAACSSSRCWLVVFCGPFSGQQQLLQRPAAPSYNWLTCITAWGSAARCAACTPGNMQLNM
jgi:hypothetical protein